MFGVITEVRVHPDREEEARAMLNDVILPLARAFPGFLSGHWLRALEGDVLRAVLIFDTEANALAPASKIRSDGPPPGAPVTLHSVDAYELIAQA